ncbi:hypothetical protein [Zunongwangia profunda]|jgi:hypothetical protein|nr:hypothetical protein [Zunongwangia profunda]|tara:strand:- start:2489 stop:2620 length:132 start_codon:yes stop_codon:yes gene_type:complete
MRLNGGRILTIKERLKKGLDATPKVIVKESPGEKKREDKDDKV